MRDVKGSPRLNALGEPIVYTPLPIFCLAALSAQERQDYREAFAVEKEEQFYDPQLIEWKPDEHDGKEEGDAHDMFKIWRSRRDEIREAHLKKARTNESAGFSFFIDRQCLSHKSVVVAATNEPAIPPSEQAQVVLDLWTTEQRHRMKTCLRKVVESYRARQGNKQTRSLEEELEESLLWDARDLELDFYSEHRDLEGSRDIDYGRFPAEKIGGVFANLSISNMGMGELVLCSGREEVESEGIVCRFVDPEWNDAEHLRLYSQAIDAKIGNDGG